MQTATVSYRSRSSTLGANPPALRRSHWRSPLRGRASPLQGPLRRRSRVANAHFRADLSLGPTIIARRRSKRVRVALAHGVAAAAAAQRPSRRRVANADFRVDLSLGPTIIARRRRQRVRVALAHGVVAAA